MLISLNCKTSGGIVCLGGKKCTQFDFFQWNLKIILEILDFKKVKIEKAIKSRGGCKKSFIADEEQLFLATSK